MFNLWVGTSGYRYWPGDIYPPKTSDADSLKLYAQALSSVEINRTFYQLPRPDTIQKWLERVPPDFVWAVKIWRRISHEKRLVDIDKDWTTFLERVHPLVQSHGVLLLQLSKGFPFSRPRLENLFKELPKGIRLAVEFRATQWFSKATYTLLEKYGVACVSVSAPGIPATWDVQTAPFAYFRFHGPRQWYKDRYTPEELKPAIAAARKALLKGDVYAYFDNTIGAHAYWNALEFKDALKPET